jgi:neurotransmitter:Na+ symporter, NSS family
MSGPHATWTSRAGFLFATIGFSVGLGNIWRFPWLAGENGGGAFVLIYLCCVALITLPIVISELTIGRRGGMTPAATMRKLALAEGKSPKWAAGGWIAMVSVFLIGTFYCVIGGWTLAYIWYASSGELAGIDTAGAQSLFDALMASPAWLIFWMLLFLLANVLIVERGLQKGVERATSILMPLLFLMLIGLCILALAKGDAAAGLRFLFVPDFSVVKPGTWLTALGQAFFSVGVGMAGMMLYGAYLPKEVKIPGTAAVVASADTLVAILAGVAIFPFLFAQGLQPAQGPGLVFVVMPVALQGTGIASFALAVFFALLAVAALTSMIAFFELVAAWGEERGWNRRRTVWGMGASSAAFGLLTVFSLNLAADFHPLGFLAGFEGKTMFDVIDWLTSNLGLTLAGLISALFAGWVLSASSAADELHMRVTDPVFRIWRVLVRWVVPVVVVVLIAAALVGLGDAG